MSEDIFDKLEAAGSEAERDWLLLEMVLQTLEPAVQAAVWAAAVPHWFDAPYLAALVEETAVDPAVFAALTELSFVELFPGRGYNVHERTRALLLDKLWRDDRSQYRELSRRAATYCTGQDQAETAWRVETIYHRLLAGDPDAPDEFSGQGIDWYNAFAYDKVETLINPVLTAVQNGRLSGDIAAWAYYWQGSLDIIYSRNHEAKTHLERALSYHVEDQAVQANCIQALGDVHVMLAEYEAARGRYEAALPIYEGIGDRLGQANTILNLGYVHRNLEEYDQAREKFELARKLYHSFGGLLGEANVLLALGDLDRFETRWGDAKEKYTQTLTYYQRTGMVFNIALAYQRLGHAEKGAGNMKAAQQYYEQALDLFTQIGSPTAQSVQTDLDNLL